MYKSMSYNPALFKKDEKRELLFDKLRELIDLSDEINCLFSHPAMDIFELEDDIVIYQLKDMPVKSAVALRKALRNKLFELDDRE